ncbi:predicted protein [Chaetomium globosum CBS 148.51]|uniref:Uncharacterized protein n=1 Tax=Chaetomium globosum (strain ATCC 6205 / CBS 148.51 / DSM 1962 / NBRC 6347 / NRRL 1970) TaxID=306901 RepID=Q2GU81_CHAGB|nr:uncharacterized protein CHGG_08473 [Chaetomium globosum CBS 148.51]EAQ84459.1 predicted protein [Chaetomium globosum CBS 148.51]
MAPKRLGGSRRSYNPITGVYNAFVTSENAPIVRSVAAFGKANNTTVRTDTCTRPGKNMYDTDWVDWMLGCRDYQAPHGRRLADAISMRIHNLFVLGQTITFVQVPDPSPQPQSRAGAANLFHGPPTVLE